MNRIVVHVDRLVLRGFRAEDRDLLASGLRAQLVRLLAARPPGSRLLSLGHVAELGVGDLRIAAGTRPWAVGAQVARGIEREFQGPA